MPALGTGDIIGPLRRLAVIGVGDGLGGDCRHVLGARCEINQELLPQSALFGVERPVLLIDVGALVPVVVSHRGEAAFDRRRKRRILDGAHGPARRGAEELSVPCAGGWQPDLEPDRRLRSGGRDPLNAAEGRLHDGRAAKASRARPRLGSRGGNPGRAFDADVPAERMSLQRFAGAGIGLAGAIVARVAGRADQQGEAGSGDHQRLGHSHGPNSLPLLPNAAVLA